RGGFVSLLRSRAFQLGFLLPCLLQSLNSLAYLYPSVPSIPVKPSGNGPLDLGPYFTTPPWNALGYFPLGFHPNTIGLAYLLSVDVSFSCWFFALLGRPGVGAGGRGGGGGGSGGGAGGGGGRLRSTPEQGAGAWLAVAAASLWLARRTLREAWWNSIRPPATRDPGAPMSD